ncbi:hypothetical protein CsSME_00037075 [Camellia sinensis var. sinensis]
MLFLAILLVSVSGLQVSSMSGIKAQARQKEYYPAGGKQCSVDKDCMKLCPPNWAYGCVEGSCVCACSNHCS